MTDKVKKHCSNCDTKYTVEWNIEEQELNPITCPFCGYETDEEEFDEDAYEQPEDDSWN